VVARWEGLLDTEAAKAALAGKAAVETAAVASAPGVHDAVKDDGAMIEGASDIPAQPDAPHATVPAESGTH
jgi:hypothetical protein